MYLECCARRILSLQPDLLNQRGKLQEVLEAQGYSIAFYPKFHRELNWIEYYWGHAKCYGRNYCDYNIESLRRVIWEALADVQNCTIAGLYARCQRRITAYRTGISYASREFQLFTSHRRVRVHDEEE